MNFTDDPEDYRLIEDKEGSTRSNLEIWHRRFVEQAESDGLNTKSIKSYNEALLPFFEFTDIYKDVKMDDIAARFINRFLMHYQCDLARELYDKKKLELERYDKVRQELSEKKIGKNDTNFYVLEEFESTLLHRTTVLKMFLKFISTKNQEMHDYTRYFSNIKKITIAEKDTKHLTVDELDEVVDFIDKWPSCHRKYKPNSIIQDAYRNALLLLLYTYTGARSEEVVLIKLEDITEFSYKGKEFFAVKIKHGKGGKTRSIGVKREKLVKYIDYLKENLPSDDFYISALYENGMYINKPYHQNNIRKFSNYILQDALGIHKSGLHVYRRGYATKRLTKDNINIALVAKELGHSVAMLEKHYFKHDVTDTIQ